jgi:hypothetical protein
MTDKKNPFDFVTSISYTKQDLLQDHPESDYNPFLVNKSLSYHLDTSLYANEMNLYPDLPKKMQYDYLRLSIRKGKRFAKWHKPEIIEDIKIIQEYYKCNQERAKGYFKLLNKEQIEEIKQSFFKGG